MSTATRSRPARVPAFALLATLQAIEQETRQEHEFLASHPDVSGRYVQVVAVKIRALEDAARTIRAYLLPLPAA